MNIIGQNGNEGEHYDQINVNEIEVNDAEDVTPYKLKNNILSVRHKSPKYWTINLKSGETVTVPKKEAQKYLTDDPEEPKNYM